MKNLSYFKQGKKTYILLTITALSCLLILAGCDKSEKSTEAKKSQISNTSDTRPNSLHIKIARMFRECNSSKIADLLTRMDYKFSSRFGLAFFKVGNQYHLNLRTKLYELLIRDKQKLEEEAEANLKNVRAFQLIQHIPVNNFNSKSKFYLYQSWISGDSTPVMFYIIAHPKNNKIFYLLIPRSRILYFTSNNGYLCADGFKYFTSFSNKIVFCNHNGYCKVRKKVIPAYFPQNVERCPDYSSSVPQLKQRVSTLTNEYVSNLVNSIYMHEYRHGDLSNGCKILHSSDMATIYKRNASLFAMSISFELSQALKGKLRKSSSCTIMFRLSRQGQLVDKPKTISSCGSLLNNQIIINEIKKLAPFTPPIKFAI